MTDPIYKQVAEKLLDLLHSEYEPGAQFLTERQISERFSISRTTANKALANLVVDGVLQFRKGVGTFVAAPKANVDLKRLVSFTERARAAGHEPRTTTRSFARRPVAELRSLAWREVAAALGVTERTEVFEMERVRAIDGEPVVYERRAILARECDGLVREESEGSLYSVFLDRFGLRLLGVSQRIRARAATASQARTLRIERGAPLLELTGVGYCEDSSTGATPLWFEITLYRGDAYEFVNQVRASGSPVQIGVAHTAGRQTAGARAAGTNIASTHIVGGAWYAWEQSVEGAP